MQITKDTCVVLVTDKGYFAQSVLVARQLVDVGASRLADIIVYCIGIDADFLASCQRRLQSQGYGGVVLRSLTSRSYEPPPGTPFFRNHIPVTALARLSIEPELPEGYSHIVYLDGDVQIVRPIDSLLTVRPGYGRLVAGRGSAWFDPHSLRGTQPRGYLKALGGVNADEYFNSGVLAFSRETWRDYAPRALDAFFRNGKSFVRHDQSALNAVFKGSVDFLHPAFNFHSVYASLDPDESLVERRIVHFTGARKPWHLEETGPWPAEYSRPYQELLVEMPEFSSVFSLGKPARRRRTISLAGVLKHALPASHGRMRKKLADYVAQGQFAI